MNQFSVKNNLHGEKAQGISLLIFKKLMLASQISLSEHLIEMSLTLTEIRIRNIKDKILFRRTNSITLHVTQYIFTSIIKVFKYKTFSILIQQY